MDVIPAVDILGGRCVRLDQGDYARMTVFSDDPVAVAKRWQDEGAHRLHIVDLDGARQGHPANQDAIHRLLGAISVPVQVGGGIRDLAVIQRYLDAGADRVVLGTAALKDQTTLINAVTLFRERIVVGIDAREGRVATEGWLDTSHVSATDLLRQLSEFGISRVIYTDILRDGLLAGPNFEGIAALVSEASSLPSPVSVVAAGGVGSLDDLRRMSGLGVEAVIVGKALYTGAIALADAMAAVS